MLPNFDFILRSPAFTQGTRIPTRHTGDGADLSPALTWTTPPAGTVSLALICDDPDAPTPGAWVHWVIYDLAPTLRGLPEGVPQQIQVAGALTARQGPNTWPDGRVGYNGPMPPPGHGVHHYHFQLYALDRRLDLPPGADKAALKRAMSGHILARTTLTGTYERKA
jgi:Raf kinase inhibitor-like YbhB/YbcL family protein